MKEARHLPHSPSHHMDSEINKLTTCGNERGFSGLEAVRGSRAGVILVPTVARLGICSSSTVLRTPHAPYRLALRKTASK